jgi:quinol monooxygenase YgiN/ketosteroid isomerase-like protein
VRRVAAPNEGLIERFYAAFAQRDGAGMEACYAPDVTFTDPVFQKLEGPEAGAMWRMLTGRSKDLRIELLEHEADGVRGAAHWSAHYTYTQTGRPVVNDVHASFRFAGGLIAEHVDEFDLYRWQRQALGTTGILLGWTPIMRSTVRKRARRARRVHGERALVVLVVGRVRCRPEQRADLVALLERMQEESRREQGCLRYGFFAAVEDPLGFVAVEEWADREALDRHFAQPHLREFARSLPALVCEPPEVAIHDVAGTQPFPGSPAAR